MWWAVSPSSATRPTTAARPTLFKQLGHDPGVTDLAVLLRDG
jgi:hypothetical protein